MKPIDGAEDVTEICHLNYMSFFGIPELSGRETASFLRAYFFGGI